MEEEAVDCDRVLRKVQRIARLMDSRWRIPLTTWRIGLDPLLGLLPGGGDAATMLVGAYIVVQARRMGVPNALIAKMVGNVALDFFVGAIPLLGDLFDVAFKANTRNVALLEKWVQSSRAASPRRA